MEGICKEWGPPEDAAGDTLDGGTVEAQLSIDAAPLADGARSDAADGSTADVGGDGPIPDGPAIDGPGDGPAPPDARDAPADAPAIADRPGMDLPNDVACPALPACTVGHKRCVNDGVSECRVIGGCPAWAPEVHCGKGCKGEPPEAHCECPHAQECTNRTFAADGCATDTDTVRCYLDADGCGYHLNEVRRCPGARQCDWKYPASCICPPVPEDCDGDREGTFCDGTRLATCGHDLAGCIRVTDTSACPADKPCQAGGSLAASCSCPQSSPDCPGVGRICREGGRTLATCGLGANGCLTTLSTVTCPEKSTCSGGLSSADCHCTDGVCAPQAVGRDFNDEESTVIPTGVLEGIPLTFKTAFSPQRFGLWVKGDLNTRRGIIALYDSGPSGDPNMLRASNHELDGISSSPADPRVQRDVYTSGEKPILPSGKYWMMIAVATETPIVHSPPSPTERVSVPYTIGSPLPTSLQTAVFTRGTTPLRSYFMLVDPK